MKKQLWPEWGGGGAGDRSIRLFMTCTGLCGLTPPLVKISLAGSRSMI